MKHSSLICLVTLNLIVSACSTPIKNVSVKAEAARTLAEAFDESILDCHLGLTKMAGHDISPGACSTPNPNDPTTKLRLRWEAEHNKATRVEEEDLDGTTTLGPQPGNKGQQDSAK